uniref:Histone H4 n=1 Tax=Pyramimonas obovata TaxID=1411642 RepID=A0A7S0RQW4_9CHLO|mmetsp:Transcript_4519/g.9215  ORF Transcript_4519/g.9215 Transcript_4519/m.9215 type:complete len:185 (+) Transcript_4519:57-611(+)
MFEDDKENAVPRTNKDTSDLAFKKYKLKRPGPLEPLRPIVPCGEQQAATTSLPSFTEEGAAPRAAPHGVPQGEPQHVPQEQPRVRPESKGLGKCGAKRHRRVVRDNIQGITKPAIRRLARRGGVKRIHGLVYDETRGVLRSFLEKIMCDVLAYTQHARRMHVTVKDVLHALKRNGRTLYGFGEC